MGKEDKGEAWNVRQECHDQLHCQVELIEREAQYGALRLSPHNNDRWICINVMTD